MMKLRINPLVAKYLKSIKDYIAEDNADKALETIQEIYSQFENIQQFPYIGVDLSKRVSFKTDYKYVVWKDYVVLYKVGKEVVEKGGQSLDVEPLCQLRAGGCIDLHKLNLRQIVRHIPQTGSRDDTCAAMIPVKIHHRVVLLPDQFIKVFVCRFYHCHFLHLQIGFRLFRQKQKRMLLVFHIAVHADIRLSVGCLQGQSHSLCLIGQHLLVLLFGNRKTILF